MTQYPDNIVVTIVTPAIQNPTTGSWSEGTASTFTSSCRLEPNRSGRQVMGDDGVLRDYSYTCYLPLTTTVIPMGSAFTATTLNNSTITGTVKMANNGQLNSRLWL